jgi:hypothetical protein
VITTAYLRSRRSRSPAAAVSRDQTGRWESPGLRRRYDPIRLRHPLEVYRRFSRADSTPRTVDEVAVVLRVSRERVWLRVSALAGLRGHADVLAASWDEPAAVTVAEEDESS